MIYPLIIWKYLILTASIESGMIVPGITALVINAGFISTLFWIHIKNHEQKLYRIRKTITDNEQALAIKEENRLQLETRHKDITDSIKYASRIQQALLPTEEYFSKFITESFILHMPKDILSGDFYWFTGRDNKVFVAAADCTGHGVPGALMSIMGFDMLDKAVNTENIEDPSSILEYINSHIKKNLGRNKTLGTVIKDGIDLGLCVVDYNRKKVIFSGAMFTLFQFRNNTLSEIKGDRFSLGMMPPEKKFTNREIDLVEGDIMYMFSDGYVDQFGGTENKKFKYRRFRALLSIIHKYPVKEQKNILKENIITWKGTNPQVDDILVMGFKPARELV